MIDSAYSNSRYLPPVLEHHYGDGVNLLDDPMAWSLLTVWSLRCSVSTLPLRACPHSSVQLKKL